MNMLLVTTNTLAKGKTHNRPEMHQQHRRQAASCPRPSFPKHTPLPQGSAGRAGGQLIFIASSLVLLNLFFFLSFSLSTGKNPRCKERRPRPSVSLHQRSRPLEPVITMLSALLPCVHPQRCSPPLPLHALLLFLCTGTALQLPGSVTQDFPACSA